MTVTCNVNYYSTIVFPKQYLTGTVSVQSSDASQIEFIIIDVIGIATCEWNYQKPFLHCLKIYRKGTKFKGNQEFFHSRHTLAGGEATFTLTSELQVYRFKTFLPEYLPATWIGQFGSIQYTVKIILKEANELHQVFPSEITIKPYRDLNLEKHLFTEVLQKVNRTFRFGFVNLGNVEVTIWVPFCGVAAGQSIPILCTVTNNSRVFFGGLVFVLTQIQIYKSTDPAATVKTIRKDICRVARMVDILHGRYEYYAVLETDKYTPPTNQYYRCNCCQLIYEIWVSVQGVLPRYSAYGYPNIDTPGISVIIGTKPLYNLNINEITKNIIEYINESKSLTEIYALHTDDEVEAILKNADEALDKETEWNISRQLFDATAEMTPSSSKTEKYSNDTNYHT